MFISFTNMIGKMKLIIKKFLNKKNNTKNHVDNIIYFKNLEPIEKLIINNESENQKLIINNEFEDQNLIKNDKLENNENIYSYIDIDKNDTYLDMSKNNYDNFVDVKKNINVVDIIIISLLLFSLILHFTYLMIYIFKY